MGENYSEWNSKHVWFILLFCYWNIYISLFFVIVSYHQFAADKFGGSID